MAFPTQVRLVEMSPRDGLQNAPGPVINTAIKTGLIDRLEEEGIVSAPNHAGRREVLATGAPGGD